MNLSASALLLAAAGVLRSTDAGENGASLQATLLRAAALLDARKKSDIDPDEYRKKKGKCPRGFHFDPTVGKCSSTTEEDLDVSDEAMEREALKYRQARETETEKKVLNDEVSKKAHDMLREIGDSQWQNRRDRQAAAKKEHDDFIKELGKTESGKKAIQEAMEEPWKPLPETHVKRKTNSWKFREEMKKTDAGKKVLSDDDKSRREFHLEEDREHDDDYSTFGYEI